VTVENVVGNFLMTHGGNSHCGDNKEESSTNYQALSEASAALKALSHCVAYDYYNYGYSANDDAYRGSNYNTYRYGYDDDYAWNYYYSKKYSSNDVDCYDDADYTNVNQCMKFMAKTTMSTAIFRDISVTAQGTTLVDQAEATVFHQTFCSTNHFRGIRACYGDFMLSALVLR
jgi:hypothetical protein